MVTVSFLGSRVCISDKYRWSRIVWLSAPTCSGRVRKFCNNFELWIAIPLIPGNNVSEEFGGIVQHAVGIGHWAGIAGWLCFGGALVYGF